jgi:hypothetical protein
LAVSVALGQHFARREVEGGSWAGEFSIFFFFSFFFLCPVKAKLCNRGIARSKKRASGLPPPASVSGNKLGPLSTFAEVRLSFLVGWLRPTWRNLVHKTEDIRDALTRIPNFFCIAGALGGEHVP